MIYASRRAAASARELHRLSPRRAGAAAEPPGQRGALLDLQVREATADYVAGAHHREIGPPHPELEVGYFARAISDRFQHGSDSSDL